ncbi:Dyp-type peroxidase family protein [Rubripirellula lacrimiformis]|uniref:Dyp-type peroxidase family protein n=1 Tax=Rubripirellula lacrimiformis TaxID=1930273 RepID=A0A517N7J6_9BACT|nr:Dyp-type peroxidase [Rubripirellula lacrimiformis]QDT03101.1 Dyp-type peroxidase family protein [Rubripirellula lacrimiformis]
MVEPQLATDQIQANISPGFRFPFQHFIAIKTAGVDEARRLIGELLPRITTMDQALGFHESRLERARESYNFGISSFRALESHPVWVNVAFGNELLNDLIGNAADNADRSFRLGLHRRSFTLGDHRDPSNEGHKSNWLVGGPDNAADLFLIVGSSNDATLDGGVESLVETVQHGSHEVIYEERGTRLGNDEEHFGFRDGVSQPAMRGRVSAGTHDFLAKRRVQNSPTGPEWASPGSPLVWPGEFVFGYPRQSSNHFRDPSSIADTDDILKNGSFLVFRRLKQDVPLFRKETARMASDLAAHTEFSHFDKELLRASIVGRWPDGTPVQQSPDGSPAQAVSDDRINYFGFGSDTPPIELADGRTVQGTAADPDGVVCPFHAHIRKVNPRDRSTDLGAETNTMKMRILRRGIPFGPAFDDAPDETDRGLLFLCYQTSIRDQFEQLMIRWVNSTVNPEPGNNEGHDMILGQSGASADRERFCVFKDTSGSEATIATKKDWIITTGGGYFFCPSIDALRLMAGSL